jgi:Zn-finger nucleic acid-binding protein
VDEVPTVVTYKQSEQCPMLMCMLCKIPLVVDEKQTEITIYRCPNCNTLYIKINKPRVDSVAEIRQNGN